MADFVEVLRKTIEGLVDNTPALRAKVYDKARATVARKLTEISPPPPAAVARRQMQVLEDAIHDVEAYFSSNDDPFAELTNVFGGPTSGRPSQTTEAGENVESATTPPPSRSRQSSRKSSRTQSVWIGKLPGADRSPRFLRSNVVRNSG